MIDLDVAIVYRSTNGEDGWTPVKQEDVPDWVTDPDNMAHLLDGEACQKDNEGDWFTAIRTSDLIALVKANTKIETRRARRLQIAKPDTVH